VLFLHETVFGACSVSVPSYAWAAAAAAADAVAGPWWRVLAHLMRRNSFSFHLNILKKTNCQFRKSMQLLVCQQI